MSIGKRIRDLRKRQGLTQLDLAKRIGTTKQNVTYYEKDVIKNIPLEKIQILAEIFDVSPAYILGIDEPETDINTEHTVLLAMYDECDQEARKNITDYSRFQLTLSRERSHTEDK